MSNEANKDKFRPIRDPIWGDINIPEKFKDIIDSLPIQRLRYIKHGGFMFLSLPSANHSRFEHTLGTYYLSGRFKERLGMSGGVIYLALLHHIDDPPFSYATNEVIQNIRKKEWGKNYRNRNKEFIENLISYIPYFKEEKQTISAYSDSLMKYKEYKKPLATKGTLVQYMGKKQQFYAEHPILFITSVIDSECRNSHYMGLGKPQGVEVILNFIKKENGQEQTFNNILVDSVLREIKFYALSNAMYHVSVEQSRLIGRLVSRILFSIYESKSHNKVWWYGEEIKVDEILTDAKKFLDFNDYALLQIIDDLLNKEDSIKGTNIHKYLKFYKSAITDEYEVYEPKWEWFDFSIIRKFIDMEYDELIEIEKNIARRLNVDTIIIDSVSRSIVKGFLPSDIYLTRSYSKIEFSHKISDIEEIHPDLLKVRIFTLKKFDEKSLENAFKKELSIG